jgi:hypothetical protein
MSRLFLSSNIEDGHGRAGMRVDVAKLPTYFALLYLWAPARAFAAKSGRAWPLEATAPAAFAEFARIFTQIPMPGQAKGCPSPCSRPLNENGLRLAIMKAEVLNITDSLPTN